MYCIKKESREDYPQITELLIKAFATHPYSQQTEHLIVPALRQAGALALALVVHSQKGDIVGYIAFSHASVEGEKEGWYALGPIAVLPELQKQGIGTLLMKEGLRQIQALGAVGVVLVGDPHYYQHFGFQPYPDLYSGNIPQE